MNYKIYGLLFIFAITTVFIAGCSSNTNNTPQNTMPLTAKDGVVNFGMNRGFYTPKEIVIEAGKPVTLRNDGTIKGCSRFVVQPELGINANFARNTDYTFTPQKKGRFVYSCSMGMFSGVITVV